MRHTISPTQKALKESYRKQRKRILQFIKRAESRGYVFNFELPKKPKRITEASVRRLQKITPKKLYEKSKAVDFNTGEILSGTEYRKRERKEAARRAAVTRSKTLQYSSFADITINNFISGMSHIAKDAYSVLIGWINEKMTKDGKLALAKAISDFLSGGNSVAGFKYLGSTFYSGLGELSKLLGHNDKNSLSELNDTFEENEENDYEE